MAGPYTLSGSGIQTIATPAALIVTVTTAGFKQTQGRANPPNIYNVGLLTPGDAQGWYPAVGIGVSPQKIPLPAGCTQLGYAMIAGSVVQVAEVAPPPALNSSLNPWDRSPTPWGQSSTVFAAGGTASTVAWSYTVPAGKILRLVRAHVSIDRFVVATAQGSIQAYLTIAGVIGPRLDYWGNTLGQHVQDDLDGGPYDLPAGTVVTGTYANGDTGGNAAVFVNAEGYLFNA